MQICMWNFARLERGRLGVDSLRKHSSGPDCEQRLPVCDSDGRAQRGRRNLPLLATTLPLDRKGFAGFVRACHQFGWRGSLLVTSFRRLPAPPSAPSGSPASPSWTGITTSGRDTGPRPVPELRSPPRIFDRGERRSPRDESSATASSTKSALASPATSRRG